MARRKAFTPHEDEALIFGYTRGHARKEISEILKVTRRQITRRLEKLKENGVI